VAQLELVVLELDFCLLERAGTRATLNETAEMDDFHNCRRRAAPTVGRLSQVVPSGSVGADAPFVLAKRKFPSKAMDRRIVGQE